MEALAGRQEVLARERSWALPVALAAFLAVALMVASQLASRSVSGDGDAEVLLAIHEHSGAVALAGAMQAVSFALIALPLLYLFRMAQARSDRVRSQLVGLIVVAPIFLAVSSGLTIGARGEAADQFVAGEAESTLSANDASEDCGSQRADEGAEDFTKEFESAKGETALAACRDRKIEDDEASNAVGEASLTPFVSGLGLGGGLGLAITFLYVGLWAMRTGVLTRFWGSLGMVAGIAFLLGPLFFVTLVWLLYFGFLVLGAVPGGRPPAWERGEAVPWPTPGEKAASELEPPEPTDPDEDHELRKRKQRD